MWHLLAQAEPSNVTLTIDKLARTPLSQVVLFVAVLTAIRIACQPLLVKTPAHLRTGKYGFVRFTSEGLDAIVYAGGFVFLLIRPFALQAFTIPTESMLDTLLVSDFIGANKAVYRYSEPKVGDIVVFRPPLEAARPEQIGPDGQVNVDFVKRLVGTPGQVVEIRDGYLYRDGVKIAEPYAKGPAVIDFKLVKYRDQYWPVTILGDAVNSHVTTVEKYAVDSMEAGRLLAQPAVAIPPGYYLFIGDNRNNSWDGRMWGLVPRESIVGRAEFIWWPANRWRITR